MQKKLIISYLFILATLLGFMSLSRPATEKIRGQFIAFLAPLWNSISSMKSNLHYSSSVDTPIPHESGINLTPQEEIHRLQLTNEMLTNELLHLSRIMEEKQNFDKTLAENSTESITDPHILSTGYPRYLQRLKESIALKTQAIPARVLFRSMDTWNSSFWINVGEANNEVYHSTIVAKNSPVLVGNAIIGVVDYVGKHQSRVCLITDPRLTSSVRVARGGEQDAVLNEYIEFILNALKRKKDFTTAETERESLIHALTKMRTTLNPMKKSWYLAKGELHGSMRPISRGQSQILKGTGFNYDFSDEEGEARDLRSGKVINKPEDTSVALLKVNDILITTGMDGIFPPNLKVAIITKIDPLKEGDYFYELEAKPIAGDLNELSLVFVIPPVGYDQNDTK